MKQVALPYQRQKHTHTLPSITGQRHWSGSAVLSGISPCRTSPSEYLSLNNLPKIEFEMQGRICFKSLIFSYHIQCHNDIFYKCKSQTNISKRLQAYFSMNNNFYIAILNSLNQWRLEQQMHFSTMRLTDAIKSVFKTQFVIIYRTKRCFCCM